jgi:protein-S-isoprenylcysteine O-methyltransferase Ste14
MMNQEFLIKALVAILLVLFFIMRNKFTRYYKKFLFKFLIKYFIVIVIILFYFSNWIDFAIFNMGIYLRLVMGLFLIGIGYSLFFSAHKSLGKNWSSLMDKKVSNHKTLIKTGIYRYVRHPMYLASLITVLGFGILTANWIIFSISFLFLLIFYIYKVPKEEKFLINSFGKKYIKYKKETWGFFPKLT